MSQPAPHPGPQPAPHPGPHSDRVPRVTLTDGGPLLVEGPVELETPDGEIVRSERPVVAVCTCRRSKRFPFCDTSHRKKVRQTRVRSDDDPASQDRMR